MSRARAGVWEAEGRTCESPRSDDGHLCRRERRRSAWLGLIFGLALVVVPAVAHGDQIPVTAPAGAGGDFDGDGLTDIALFETTTGIWTVWWSHSGYTAANEYQYGTTGDVPIPADYDGDGGADLAIYRPSTGQWFFFNWHTGTSTVISWGISSDLARPGNYDADAKADLMIVRPSGVYWYDLKSTVTYDPNQPGVYVHGASGDIAIPADYDGDGKTDPAIYRPSTGAWYILKSSSGYTTTQTQVWGVNGDVPVPGDYDGDGKADMSVWRPWAGMWYTLESHTGYNSYWPQAIGQSGDLPLSGDYDGDGAADAAVYRTASGGNPATLYALTSGSGFTSTVTHPLPSLIGVTIDRQGTGTGGITGASLWCPGGSTTQAVSCGARYAPNTTVTLTAVPDSTSTFAGWEGACSGLGTCDVTMSTEQLVVAQFSRLPTVEDVAYYHTDRIASVRALTNGTGATTIRYDYGPFGEDTTNIHGDPMRFAGKELDPETAYYYFGARYYRNIWGRFSSGDPVPGNLTDPQSWNRYAYARNNPLKFVDPTGLRYWVTGFDDSDWSMEDDGWYANFDRTFAGIYYWLDGDKRGGSIRSKQNGTTYGYYYFECETRGGCNDEEEEEEDIDEPDEPGAPGEGCEAECKPPPVYCAAECPPPPDDDVFQTPPTTTGGSTPLTPARSAGQCFAKNFKFAFYGMNRVLFETPLKVSRTVFGLMTAGATARSTGLTTFGMAFKDLIRGQGVANLGVAGTLASVAANSAVNGAFVLGAMEGGFIVGSLGDAAYQTFVANNCG